MPQARSVARTPRWRTSRPTSRTPAELARTVSTRPMTMATAVPVSLPTSATGTISNVIPGGWTRTKSRYGRLPVSSRTALPK